MIISIDFDDTFTRSPQAFTEVIQTLRDYGYFIICTSSRVDNRRNRLQLKEALPHDIDIFLTGGQAKRDFLEQKGYLVDIWVDDLPQDIVHKKIWRNKPK